MLASILGFGRERHVQACDEVLRGSRVVAGCGEAGRELAQSVISAEVGAGLGEAGLLGWVLVQQDWQVIGWTRTHETQWDALLGGDGTEDGKACEEKFECHCE